MLLLLSATCSPCRSLAMRLTRGDIRLATVALISGSSRTAEAIADLLPNEVMKVFDPRARDAAASLDIDSVPFGLRIENGLVQAKTYLHDTSDVARLQGPGTDGKDRKSARDLLRLVRKGAVG